MATRTSDPYSVSKPSKFWTFGWSSISSITDQARLSLIPQQAIVSSSMSTPATA
jgi:hypothetical protein